MTEPSGETRMPPSLRERLLFSLPAIVVTLVAAVALSLWLVRHTADGVQTDLRAEFETQTKKLNAQLLSAKAENETLTKKLTAVEGLLHKADEGLKGLSQSMEGIATALSRTRETLQGVSEQQSEKLESHQTTLATHADLLAEHNSRLIYVESDLKEKFAAVEGDLQGLRGDTSSLQNEARELRSSLTAVSSKSDITAGEVKELETRTQKFQMRVLAARAREAADAARRMDLSQLVNHLKEVKEGDNQ